MNSPYQCTNETIIHQQLFPNHQPFVCGDADPNQLMSISLERTDFHPGYVGAYLHTGFASSLVAQVEQERPVGIEEMCFHHLSSNSSILNF